MLAGPLVDATTVPDASLGAAGEVGQLHPDEARMDADADVWAIALAADRGALAVNSEAVDPLARAGALIPAAQVRACLRKSVPVDTDTSLRRATSPLQHGPSLVEPPVTPPAAEPGRGAPGPTSGQLDIEGPGIAAEPLAQPIGLANEESVPRVQVELVYGLVGVPGDPLWIRLYRPPEIRYEATRVVDGLDLPRIRPCE